MRPELLDPEFLIAYLRDHTKFDANLVENIIKEWKAYKAIGLEPKEIKDFMDRWKYAAELAGLCKEAGADRLRELAEADSKGLVRILPYSVLAYKIYTKRNRHGNIHKRIIECVNYGFPESEIGKTVFLTREAAEAALKAGDTP